MITFEIGDRVTMKPEAADGFKQPWRGRFENGREGTVMKSPHEGFTGVWVEWDHRKSKYANGWRLRHLNRDLIKVAKA
jgi:hypothetical protein